AERDIYRPGEKVNFSVIIRDGNWKSPGELPVVLRFLLPNGKELKTFRKTLNEQGSLAGDVDLAVSAITGSYSLEVYSSNEILLASKSFSVEEFVPDRIKVTARLDKNLLAPAEPVSLSINAVNFFGPAASNRNYEAEIQVKSKYFQVKKYSGFNFSIMNQAVSNEKVLREGKTDEAGNASESYLVPAIFKNMGLLEANFYATVFDETGRPVSRMVSADIFTQQQFFGIADDGYSYYPLNQQIRFPVIAVDKDQRVLSGARAQVKIIKHEYRTVLSKAGSYFRYESQADDKLLTDQEVTISGDKTNYTFTPRSPGNYELRLYIPGANSYVSKSFYSYGSWGNNNSSFEVNTEGNIDISLDKAGYQPGESVKALFKAPFNGRMLVTLETDKILSYQYVEVSNRSASLDLKMTEAHMPNVYITASLIKPHTQSEIPLTVAHGFQSIKVDAKSRNIPVEIIAAKSSRSKTHQKVTVKASPGSFITLAAVDNGVLQVTGFPTPDPYNYFYAKKALGVNAFDMYPLLFPELKANLSSTGGDGELSMDKRTNPMPAKRVKVVSYWSGISKANSNGESDFEFDVPQFSGEIRLMAVAYKDDRFGSKASAITIADPLVLSTSLPRFLSPNDTVSMPVTITNTTARAATANASLQVSGPLKVVGTNIQNINLAANSEARVLFRIVASPAIATGKIRIDVQGMGEKFSEETEIGVR
ncbi:MAG: alpha-2-macroglobulin family protein, partial [Chitinophagaceae bacterium]